MGSTLRFLQGLVVIISTFCAEAVSGQVANFARADSIARAVGPPRGRSVYDLGQALAAVGPNETQRARAAYTWVTANIVYDVALFRSGAAGVVMSEEEAKSNPRAAGQLPEKVLGNGKAVCQGYTQLYAALCKSMGLKALLVHGYDREYMDANDGKLTLSHAWNLVRAEGNWHLVDATWGAGSIGNRDAFMPIFDDSYFFTAPELFVLKHLPADPIAQLLPDPVPIRVFAQEKGQITAWLNSHKARVQNSTDTLDSQINLPDKERDRKANIRTLASNPDASLARLKLAEYHTQEAVLAMGAYQEGIADYNSGKIKELTPAMRSALASAEQNLQAANAFLKPGAGSNKEVAMYYGQYKAQIDANLKQIATQRKFWKI
jgi:hypothetical protein